MKIALLEPLNVSEEMLREIAAPVLERGHELTVYDTKADSSREVIRRAQGMDAVIIANTPFPAEAVTENPALKYIDVAFTGVDHVPMEACRARGVLVSNAANYSNQSVAELTVGMAIALLRRLPDCDAAVRAHQGSAGLIGREIAERTVGIVGLGRIGLRVARLMLAFGARVVAYDPKPMEQARQLGVQYASLREVLESSDIVTLHAPACAQTHKMIGEAELAQMKPGALFINCARGALVDSQALCDALRSGHLAGAAVDVYDREPPLDDSEPLLHAPNIILTPHIAFASEESMLRRARIVFQNLYAWLDGEPINLC